jgi:beta-fructofuranosidase
VKKVALSGKPRVLEDVGGAALELVAELELGNAKMVGLQVRRSEDGKRGVEITYDGNRLEVAGLKAPFKLLEAEKTLRLHVFLDRSVVEVYANRRVCMTRVVEAGKRDLGVAAFASGGKGRLKAMESWPMASAWVKVMD